MWNSGNEGRINASLFSGNTPFPPCPCSSCCFHCLTGDFFSFYFTLSFWFPRFVLLMQYLCIVKDWLDFFLLSNTHRARKDIECESNMRYGAFVASILDKDSNIKMCNCCIHLPSPERTCISCPRTAGVHLADKRVHQKLNNFFGGEAGNTLKKRLPGLFCKSYWALSKGQRRGSEFPQQDLFLLALSCRLAQDKWSLAGSLWVRFLKANLLSCLECHVRSWWFTSMVGGRGVCCAFVS